MSRNWLILRVTGYGGRVAMAGTRVAVVSPLGRTIDVSEWRVLTSITSDAPGNEACRGIRWVSSTEWVPTAQCNFQEILVRPQETVPEPATITLLATGLAGLAASRRRKTR